MYIQIEGNNVIQQMSMFTTLLHNSKETDCMTEKVLAFLYKVNPSLVLFLLQEIFTTWAKLVLVLCLQRRLLRRISAFPSGKEMKETSRALCNGAMVFVELRAFVESCSAFQRASMCVENNDTPRMLADRL